MSTTSESAAASIIGSPTPRIDGPLKTTGAAQYSADFHFDRMVHAVPVCATIATGKIAKIDTSGAEKMPGVMLILHHGNIGPLYRTVPGDDNATNSEVRSAFEDEIIRHWGQYVAVAVAETLEQATAAAAAVKVEYEAARQRAQEPGGLRRQAKIRFQTRRSRCCIRLCASKDRPDLRHSHRNAQSHRDARFRRRMGLGSRNAVRNIAGGGQSPCGDGAGAGRARRKRPRHHPLSRLGIWGQAVPVAHAAMAAVAARKLDRPVKLSLTRRMMFSMSATGRAPNSASSWAHPGRQAARPAPRLPEQHLDAR